jgi:CheY-like chemotaxis protein
MMAEPVLVVDDDPDIRECMVALLEMRGLPAVPASDGAEALDLLKAGMRPSLILLDLMMPRMDGWEFRAQQELDPELAAIPTVVVSAAGQHATAALHADAIIRKPIDFGQLDRVLDRHCSGRAS